MQITFWESAAKYIPRPLDVRLFEEDGDTPEDVSVVVQPDISVVCDPGKTDGHGCKGAPDMVIEILSDSTRRVDKVTKLSLCQRAGVREYRIVDPFTRTVSVYLLEDGAYHAASAYGSDASVPVGVLEDCTVDLSTVFPETRRMRKQCSSAHAEFIMGCKYTHICTLRL